jgi:DNA adenine methylase
MNRYKTPLRYPGGKQRLAPFMREILEVNELVGGHYVEVYAGGAGIAIELLLSGTVERIHLNDAHKPVHAFWHSILNHTDAFCRRIQSASLTVGEWRRQRAILANADNHNGLELGFSLFFLNRCNRSGILSGGVIGGLAQTGKWKIDARFPRNELIHRIEAIANKKSSIRLRNWDAERFIENYLPRLPQKTLVYCDPPYFRKADRLYMHHYRPEDHCRIAGTIQETIEHPWVVSYDSADEIISYYRRRGMFQYDLQYTAATAYKGREVIIFADGMTIPSESKVATISAALALL